MNAAGEKALDDTPVLPTLAYFESVLEIKSLAWPAVALPNRRAPGYRKMNLNDAELSSIKGSLIYHCACIAWVRVHADTHTLTISLAFYL